MERYTVTTALPYANGPLHLGHVAGMYIPADIYVRYLRQKGADVVFIGGTDEHGVPITIQAKKEGLTPQQLVDKNHTIIKNSLQKLGISLDIFSQTSHPDHYKVASEWFEKFLNDGAFIEETTEQFYDAQNNQFLADRYIKGTCPHCGNEEAYGDQCEKCGTSLSPNDLINPKSVLTGNTPELKETKHWYLPLNKYEAWLKNWLLEENKHWKSNVYGQCSSWLKAGLQPRAITRDLDWGVPVPVKGAEGKVMYVWFDAPIAYVTFTQQLMQREADKFKGKSWEDYWKKSGESKLVHFLGKDNIVFHCIIFPSMLKQMGDYVLPYNVPANEFLNLEGEKFSTSRNWAVWLDEFLAEFPEQTDVLRYVLCSVMPEQKDADFTWKDFQAKNNNELVANFGNFINRTIVLTHKYYNGVVPKMGKLLPQDEAVLQVLKDAPKNISDKIEQYKFREALAEMMKVSFAGNKYLADEEPWKVVKTDAERVETIMFISLQIAQVLAQVSAPFLPQTSQKLLRMLHTNCVAWDEIAGSVLASGHTIAQAELLFGKIEDEVVDQQLLKLQDKKKAATTKNIEPSKDLIQFEDFQKMDIRVATIVEAKKVPKTKKLLEIKLDTGIDQRTVVSGIAEFYEPENIIGQEVLVLVNLAPRDLKGIPSQGMILMAEDAEGKLSFVSPTNTINNGGLVK